MEKDQGREEREGDVRSHELGALLEAETLESTSKSVEQAESGGVEREVRLDLVVVDIGSNILQHLVAARREQQARVSQDSESHLPDYPERTSSSTQHLREERYSRLGPDDGFTHSRGHADEGNGLGSRGSEGGPDGGGGEETCAEDGRGGVGTSRD